MSTNSNLKKDSIYLHDYKDVNDIPFEKLDIVELCGCDNCESRREEFYTMYNEYQDGRESYSDFVFNHGYFPIR